MPHFYIMVFYIIGYFGSGKSTIGRKLARKLNCDFFDTDRMVEERFNLNEFDVFQKYGADLYRQTEVEVIQQLQGLTNAVISCGGGLPCHSNNIDFINHHGKSIYIKMSPKSLAIRLFNARKKRALIQDHLKSLEKVEEFIVSQLVTQELIFNQAHIEIKGENINVDKIVQLIGVELGK